MTKNHNIKIGIFDSGLGGLTVLKSLRTTFGTQVSFVYLGDLAHLPYGEKSSESIIKYSDKICQFLLSKQVDMIIVACNSASSLAGKYLLNKYHKKLPIIDTIHPSIKAVYQYFDNENKPKYSIGIIGTEATINSKAYDNMLVEHIKKEKSKFNVTIESIACPLFVPIVEEGWENIDIAHQIATKYLSQFQNNLDTVILGCTHYPILMKTLKFVFNKLGHQNLNFIQSGDAISDEFFHIVNNYIYRNEYELKIEKHSSVFLNSKDQFYVTDTPYQFNDLANKFLGQEINNIQLIEL